MAAFKLRRFPPVQIAIYLAVRAASAVVCMLPARTLATLGRFIGRSLYLIHPRRRLAAEQVAAADGMPRDPAAVDRIVRGMYEHIGLMAVEMLIMPRLLKGGELARRTIIEGKDVLDRLLERKRGVIVVLGHQMNWEWGGVASTRAGIPLNSVYRPIENPYIDRFLNRFRQLAGQKVLSKYEPAAAYAEILRRNEILVLLADQDAHADGIFVPYFGRPASTAKGPALFALRQRVPIVCCEIWRDPDGTHHVRYGDPIEPDEFGGGKEGVKRLTAAYVRRIEEYVRRHPEQWVWLHRRWKSQPPADQGAPEAVASLLR